MPIFDFKFTVDAPLTAVSNFHADTSALKMLNPPGIIVQMHHIDPLAEGSVSKFTLWFGPLPIHWTAVHTDVSQNGFTDTQTEGPAKKWRHTHTFTALGENKTEIHEHIDYAHHEGAKGLLTRTLFAKPNLYILFNYRKFITRRKVGQF